MYFLVAIAPPYVIFFVHRGYIFEQVSGNEIGPPILSGTKIWKLLNQINNVLNTISSAEKKATKKEIDQNGLDTYVDAITKSCANLNDSKETDGIDNHDKAEKKKRKKKAASEETQVILNEEAKNNNLIKEVELQGECLNNNENSNGNAIEKDIILNNNEVNNKLEEKANHKNSESTKKSKAKKKADKIKEQEGQKVDKPAKLSKTSSVASSLSDMSKVSSTKKDLEKRSIIMNVDWMHLEKVLNELNRFMEKVDKVTYEIT